MEANPKLQRDMRVKVQQLARDAYTSGEQEIAVHEVFAQTLENGEGIVGYQYLHGTNANAGGFVIGGKATIVPDGDGYLVTKRRS